jgi:hypothetical protein
LEYQRANFSANINKYHIFSDKKLVNDVKERGMSGYDVKLSVGEFLFVAQWQVYREFAITCSVYGDVVFLYCLPPNPLPPFHSSIREFFSGTPASNRCELRLHLNHITNIICERQ